MKRIAMMLALASFIILCHPTAAYSASVPIVVDPSIAAPLAGEGVVVSALPFSATPDFIELYNQSDQAIMLDGYAIVLVFDDEGGLAESQINLPSGYLLARSYLALAEDGVDGEFDAGYSLPETNPGQSLVAVYMLHPDGHRTLQLSNFAPTASKYTWLKRKSGSAGHFATQESFTQKEEPVTLSGFGLFNRPETAPAVRIVEILARPGSCSPFDSDWLCGDYVKLHNPSATYVDLSNFVLRSDSGSSKAGNNFSLNYKMAPDTYLTIYLRDDQTKMSLNDTGGYIWLEDRGNIAAYQSSLVSYPSVSTNKIGWSWVLDLNDSWSWTSTPQPQAANLVTSELKPEIVIPEETNGLPSCGEGRYRHPETNRCRNIETPEPELKPCAPHQERNPETNRCRNIVDVTNVLTPCAPSQERNPATNRCRSVVLSSSSLVPCGVGQERNPATNRCRSVDSEQSSMKPCAPGQERNPATNRCRKNPEVVLAVSTAPPEDTATDTTGARQPMAWYGLMAAVVAVATGYGIWEWRSEIKSGITKLIGWADHK